MLDLDRQLSSDPHKLVLNIFPHHVHHSLCPELSQKLLHYGSRALSFLIDRVYPTSDLAAGSSCNGNSIRQRHPGSCIPTRAARRVSCACCKKYVTLASLYSRYIKQGPKDLEERREYEHHGAFGTSRYTRPHGAREVVDEGNVRCFLGEGL